MFDIAYTLSLVCGMEEGTIRDRVDNSEIAKLILKTHPIRIPRVASTRIAYNVTGRRDAHRHTGGPADRPAKR
jgi:hypothetical protein